MKAINVDEWFKGREDLEEIGDGVIEQLAKNLARLQDVDIAMTPLVDLLTGYTKYKVLQSKIDKAIEYYETHQQECVIGRNKDNKLIKDYYLPAQCSKKLYEFLKEEK